MDKYANSKIPKSPVKSNIPQPPKSPLKSSLPKSTTKTSENARARSRSKSFTKSSGSMTDRSGRDRYSHEQRHSYALDPHPKPQTRQRSFSHSQDSHAGRPQEVKSDFSKIFRSAQKDLPDFENDFGPVGSTVIREIEDGVPTQDVSSLFQRPFTAPPLELSSVPPPFWARRDSQKERRDSQNERRDSQNERRDSQNERRDSQNDRKDLQNERRDFQNDRRDLTDSRRSSIRNKGGSYGFTSEDLDDILAKYKGKHSPKLDTEYQVYQTSVKTNYDNVDPDFTQGFRSSPACPTNGNGSDYPRDNSKKKSDTPEDPLQYLGKSLPHKNLYKDNDYPELNKTYRKSISKHLFPFKEIPTGELLIYPEQVAFESKAISVLVSDPLKIGTITAEKYREQDHIFKQVEEAIQKSLSHLYDKNNGKLGNFDHTPVHINEDHWQRRKSHSDDYIDKEVVFMQYSNATLGTDKLMSELHQRIRSAKHADTHVVIGDKVFPCHSLVLEVYSNYFDTLNRPRDSIRRVELPETDVPANVFPTVMDWIMQNDQGRQTVINKTNVVSLFSAAKYLEIPELKTQCITYLQEKVETNDRNLMHLWDEVKKKPKCHELMSVISSKAAVSFQNIYLEKQFLNLDVDEIVMLLNSDDIVIDSELDVYDTATRWLLKDWQERKICVNQVMSTVRFGLLSPLQLTQIGHSPDLNKDSSLKEYAAILSNPTVKSMLDQGLAYSILDESYKAQPKELEKWVESTGIKAPRPRTNLNPLSRNKNFSYQNLKDDKIPRARANNIEVDRRPSYTILKDQPNPPNTSQSLNDESSSKRSVLDMFKEQNSTESESEMPRSRSKSQSSRNAIRNSLIENSDRGGHLEDAADIAGQPIPAADIDNLTLNLRSPRRARSRSKESHKNH